MKKLDWAAVIGLLFVLWSAAIAVGLLVWATEAVWSRV